MSTTKTAKADYQARILLATGRAGAALGSPTCAESVPLIETGIPQPTDTVTSVFVWLRINFGNIQFLTSTSGKLMVCDEANMTYIRQRPVLFIHT